MLVVFQCSWSSQPTFIVGNTALPLMLLLCDFNAVGLCEQGSEVLRGGQMGRQMIQLHKPDLLRKLGLKREGFHINRQRK